MSRKNRIRARQQQLTNQQNAQHSTGPKTDEGKTIAAQNSFRHGLTASAIIALPGEDIQDYIDLANGLRVEHNPVTITEDAFVTKIAQSLWLSKRAIILQQSLFLDVLAPDTKLLALYIRYQAMHDRAAIQSLKELQALRNQALSQQTGFVLQTREQQVHEAKIRTLNARSEAIETATRHRNTVNAPSHLSIEEKITSPAPKMSQTPIQTYSKSGISAQSN